MSKGAPPAIPPRPPPPQSLVLPDGRELSYRLWEPEGQLGQGKPVGRKKVLIYLHGFPSSSLEAGLLQQEAAELGCTLVSFDRPGFGLSSFHPGKSFAAAAVDVRALMDHLGIPRATLVGSSGGAPFAAAAAAALGSRCQALLLIAPLAPVHGQQEALLEGANPHSRRLLLSMGDSTAGRLRTWVTMHAARLVQRVPHGNLLLRMGGFAPVDLDAFDAHPAHTAWLKAATRLGLSPGIQAPLQDLELFGGPHSLDLGAIACRTVVWVGSLDTTTPPAMARAFYAEGIRGAELRLVEGEGHLSLPFKHNREILASIV